MARAGEAGGRHGDAGGRHGDAGGRHVEAGGRHVEAGGRHPAGGAALGQAFALALARREFDRLEELVHPEIDFRALTPRRTWEPTSHDQVLEVLRTWFGDCDVERLACLETAAFGDRHRVGYRFLGDRAGEPFVIEQQAYFSERDGRIDWMRLACSGFRAVTGVDGPAMSPTR